MRPRVSVVIPCFNASEYLAETIESLVAQTLEEIEVIVADDGSVDDSIAIAEELARANPQRVIKTLPLEHVGHPSAPRNSGVDVAQGDLIICLDADDKLPPSFLEICADSLAAHPEFGIAYTDQLDFGGLERRHTVPEYNFFELTRGNFFGIASLFRREAWSQTGGFNANTPYEDWDFWIRCGQHGYFGHKVHGTEWHYRVRRDGRFMTYGSQRDRDTKARFVLRRPSLYTTAQQLWARAVLDDDPLSQDVPEARGVILDFQVTPSPTRLLPVVPTPIPYEDQIARIERPRVSVVIAAFNLAGYLPAAIDSAFAQHSPGGPIEVIVVDDGSTDETPEVLARYGDRIRSVRQANGGLVSAVNTALGMVKGEYVALLDADDEWPPDRLLRHVAVLDSNPQLGLVHGDMAMIDANGAVTESSCFKLWRREPPNGRVLGMLLAGNFVSGGASTFRSSLLPALYPISADAAYPDWWIAACVAAVAEISTVDGVANRYRYHGANMGLGATLADQPRIHRREIPWRRWMCHNLLDDSGVTAQHLGAAYATLRFCLLTAAQAEPLGARALLEADHECAVRSSKTLPPSGPGAPRAKALLRTLAYDPFDGAVAIDLEVALETERQLPAPHLDPLLITLQTRSEVTLGWLGEVLAEPSLLHAFAARYNDSDHTLAILAPPGGDLGPLIQLVESDQLLSGEGCDVTVLTEPATTPARRLLAARAGSRLTGRDVPAPFDRLRVIDVAAE